MSTAATADNRSRRPPLREEVFCHQCQHEWFRDEHDELVCPRCRGDFVEIVEDSSDSIRSQLPGSFDPDFGFGGDGDTDDDMDHRFRVRHRAEVEESYSFVDGPGFRVTRRTRISNPAAGGNGEPRLPDFRPSTNGGRGNRNDNDVDMLRVVQQIFANIMGDGNLNAIRNAAANNNGNNHNDSTINDDDNVDNLQRGHSDSSRPSQPTTHDQGHNQSPGTTPPFFPPFTQSARIFYESNVNADGSRTVRTSPGPPEVEDLPSVLQRVFAEHGEGLFGSIMGMGGPRGSGDYVWSETQLNRIISDLMEQHQGNAPPPAQPEVLNSLPKIKIDQQKVNEGEDCAVCKEEWVLHEEVVQLPCKHIYHEFCVKKWLEAHDTCPICRKPTSQHGENHAHSNNQQNNSNNNGQSPNHDHPQNAAPRTTTRMYGWSFGVLGGHSHNNTENDGNGNRSGPFYPYAMAGSWNSNGDGRENSTSGSNNTGQQRPPGDRNNSWGNH